MYRLNCILLVLLVALTACQASTPAPTPSVVNLRFTYWGSEMEKAAIEQMVGAFEAANPDVDVEPIQIPYEGYIARVTAMMQNGQPPDVGYLVSKVRDILSSFIYERTRSRPMILPVVTEV